MTSTRIKDKMAATRKKGKWVGGKVPFGFRVEDKKLYLDDEKAPIVRRIFNRYLEIQSPKQIARELNAEGIVTQTGKKWTIASIYRILNNYTYAGLIFYEGQVYPGEHEAIIDCSTWEMTQYFLKENAPIKIKTKRLSSQAALAGIIRCGHCNCSMRPTRSKRWGRTYNYYSCARDLDRGESICPVKSVPAGDIEKLVCDQVFQVVMSPEVISGVSRLTGLDPKNIREMFEHEFWNELTPTEKQRLMQILVEHVTVNPDDVTVELRTQNMKSVQEACNDRINS